MLRNRLLLSVLAVILCLSLLLPFWIRPAHADASFDFTSSDGGWYLGGAGVWGTCGTYNGGVGWASEPSCAGDNQALGIQYDFPSTITMSNILIHYYLPATPAGGGAKAEIRTYTTGPGWAFVTFLPSSPGDHVENLTISGSVSWEKIGILIGDQSGSDQGTNYVYSVDITSSYGPTSTPGPSPTPTMTLTPTPGPTSTPSPPIPGGCIANWTETYDFTTGQSFDWIPDNGTAVPDETGFHPVVHPSGMGFQNYIVLSKTLPLGIVDSAELTISYSPGFQGASEGRAIKFSHVTTALINSVTPGSMSHNTLSWTGSETSGVYNIEVYVSGVFNSDSDPQLAQGSASIEKLKLSGTGLSAGGGCNASPPDTSGGENIWTYPISSADRLSNQAIRDLINTVTNPQPKDADPFNDFSTGLSGSYAAIQILTRTVDVKVHAMTGGTVYSVTGLDAADPCAFHSPINIVTVPAFSCPESTTSGVVSVLYQNVSTVVVQSSNAYQLYYIRDANVTAGESITPGCVLGKTLKYAVTGVGVSFPFSVSTGNTDVQQQGLGFFQGRSLANEAFDLKPLLQIEPTDVNCGTGGGGGVEGCKYVNAPNFLSDQLFNWQPTNSADTIQNPPGESQGLWLRSGGAKQGSLNLDATVQYSVSITAHLLSGATPASFTWQLGASAAETITITSTSEETTNVAAATYMPTSIDGFMLTLMSTNNTQSNVVIDFVCVSDEASGPPLPTGGCLFQNPEFDTDTQWTKTGGATIANGIAFMPDTSTIYQSVTLYPKTGGAAQGYTITIEARRGPSSPITVDWTFGSHSGTLGSPFSTDSFQEDTDTFSVTTTAETHNFVFTSDTTTSGQISKVCITTSDGVEAPGYQHQGSIPFTAQCKVCSYSPIGDVNYDLSEVIAWLFCAISQIWFCQARAILYGIWQTAVNILAFLGMMRLWTGLTIGSFTVWVNANIGIVMRYLNGEFVNLIAQIRPPISLSAPESSTNFFDALIALIRSFADIVRSIIDGILNLAKLLVDLVLGILTLIFSLIFFLIGQILGFIRTFMALIFGVINAPPTLPAGIPICDTSASTIPESCVPIFMLDHTVFAESSPFGFIIPLVEGSIFFLLLWWAIQEFRRALTE